MDEEKTIKILEMIAQDMADDAKNFDGKPFTGRTVAEYFGNQGAAIAALANIVKSMAESRKEAAAQPDARSVEQSAQADGAKAVAHEHNFDTSIYCSICGEIMF